MDKRTIHQLTAEDIRNGLFLVTLATLTSGICFWRSLPDGGDPAHQVLGSLFALAPLLLAMLLSLLLAIRHSLALAETPLLLWGMVVLCSTLWGLFSLLLDRAGLLAPVLQVCSWLIEQRLMVRALDLGACLAGQWQNWEALILLILGALRWLSRQPRPDHETASGRGESP